MYDQRLVAFVDILGFKNLIERTVSDPGLVERVHDMLLSLGTDNVRLESAGNLNEELIPPEELAGVREAFDQMSRAMARQADIRFAYFSDCIVVSAPLANEMACFLIFELMAEIYVRVFDSYGLLIRGGIARGAVIHMQSGPLFGPAFVRAYELESKQARMPRVLLQPDMQEALSRTGRHRHMLSLFLSQDTETYISLGSSFRFLANDSSMVFASRPKLLEQYRRALEKAENLRLETAGLPYADKYSWALADLSAVQDDMKA